MNAEEIRVFVDATWKHSIIPTLHEYIKVPDLSPAFDPDWEANGYDRAEPPSISTLVESCYEPWIPNVL